MSHLFQGLLNLGRKLDVQACEGKDCAKNGLLINRSLLFFCKCGCGKRVCKACAIAHGKKVTHILQTGRMLKRRRR